MKYLVVSAVTLCCSTTLLAGNPSNPVLKSAVEPSGCIIEQIAARPGIRYFQNDSLLPDGSGIAISWDDDNNNGTYLLDLNTWKQTPLHPALDNGASFSPDGKWIVNAVYVADDNTDIVLIDRATKELSYILPHESWDWLPSFSPNGAQIVFNSQRGGNSDIYLYTLASGELQQLTNNPTYEAHAKFSPDGKFILYHEGMGGADYNVNLMELATGHVRALTSSPREESYPSWSPDGRYIAYADDRDREPGKPDIFIMDLNGKIVNRVTNHPEKDAYPFWSPDGQYLYFNSYRDGGSIYRAVMTDTVHCKQS